MNKNYPIKRKGYTPVYRDELKIVKNYLITEEEYFEYLQNSNDPTFEQYNYDVIKIVKSDTISYYDTALDILRRGDKLSVLIWQDFTNFIAEWVLTHGWSFCHIKFFRNNGINIITTKTVNHMGKIKCIWMMKKYASHRPVGVKIIRELRYLVSQTGSSKGVVVTTSRLTKDALELIDENCFTLSYIDNEMLEKELKFGAAEIADDLPF